MENIVGNVYEYKRYDYNNTVCTETIIVTDAQKFGDGSVVVTFRKTGFLNYLLPVYQQLYWAEFVQKTNFLSKT
jgi:hypothetical protein